MSKSPKRPPERPMVVQDLFDRNSQTKVARISFDRPKRSGRDWGCTVRFRGIGGKKSETVLGINAMQALMLAVSRARKVVIEDEKSLTLDFGDPAEVAFPPIIPTWFDWELARRLEQSVNSEVEKFTSELARKPRRRG